MADKFDTEKFMKDRSIVETDLTRCMAENPSFLGYYGQQAAEWKSIHDNVKLQIEIRSAEIILDVKSSGAKSTETDKKAMVETHPDIKDLRFKLLKVKEQYDLYNNAMSALDDRGRMLSSIGAWKRSEMTSTPYHSGGAVTDLLARPAVMGTGPTVYGGVLRGSTSSGTVSGTTTVVNTVPVSSGPMDDAKREEILALLNAKSSNKD